MKVEICDNQIVRAWIGTIKGNAVLNNYILFDREKRQTYKTSEFSSPAEATNSFNSKVFDIKNSLAKQLSASAINNLNAVVNNRFGYQLRRASDILWILNNKKHRSYQEHQTAWNQFKNAIVLINADEPLDKVKEKMKPVIAYFEKAKTEFTGSDKEDRKMRYASFYNLAKIYLWLDEPAKAKVEADALSMNDYDESDGKSLRSMAESLEITLKKNNSDSRHFAVNSGDYQSPVK